MKKDNVQTDKEPRKSYFDGFFCVKCFPIKCVIIVFVFVESYEVRSISHIVFFMLKLLIYKYFGESILYAM